MGTVILTRSGGTFSREFSLTVSNCIGNSSGVKFSFLRFCQLTVPVPCLLDFCWGASDLEHRSCSPVHFGLLSTILLHDLVRVCGTLAYDCCWFPRCILSVLNPYWCIWSEFNVALLWLVLLPSDEFLMGLIHLLGS